MTSVALISAGAGNPSSTRMLGDAIMNSLLAKLDHAGTPAKHQVIEVLPLATDIAQASVAGFAGPKLQAALGTVTGADFIIAVSPVFKTSYTGMFKAFIDLLDNSALEGKTVIIGMTGGSLRHALAVETSMRPLFAYMRATTTPTALYAAPEDWGQPEFSQRIEAATREALAGSTAEPRRGTANPMQSLPFEQLLAGIQNR